MSHPDSKYKKIKFLEEMPLVESEELTGMCELRTYQDGSDVFTTGSRLPGVFVVAKGALKIFRSNKKDKIQILDILRPGQCIGEAQVFSDGIASTNAQARGETECWLLPDVAVRQVIQKNPIVAEVMLRHLAGKLRRVVPLIERLSLHSVPERTAQLLLDKHRELNNSLVIQFPEKQEELSQYVGASREAFNRALRLISDLGLIKSTYPVIHIMDLPKLQRFSKGL
jgi:CRP-like cAMP-binding protein